MVIGLRWEDVVGCFFEEDLGKVRILQQEGDFRFCLLCGNGKFGCCCEFGNESGIWEEMFAITSEDSIDLAIVQGVLEVLVLCIMV